MSRGDWWYVNAFAALTIGGTSKWNVSVCFDAPMSHWLLETSRQHGVLDGKEDVWKKGAILYLFSNWLVNPSDHVLDSYLKNAVPPDALVTTKRHERGRQGVDPSWLYQSPPLPIARLGKIVFLCFLSFCSIVAQSSSFRRMTFFTGRPNPLMNCRDVRANR